MERLAECERSLGRKCYLLDAAELAHKVEVLVYGPEGIEIGGFLHSDTRVSVFIKGEAAARATTIVDTETRSVEEILRAHGEVSG